MIINSTHLATQAIHADIDKALTELWFNNLPDITDADNMLNNRLKGLVMEMELGMHDANNVLYDPILSHHLNANVIYMWDETGASISDLAMKTCNVYVIEDLQITVLRTDKRLLNDKDVFILVDVREDTGHDNPQGICELVQGMWYVTSEAGFCTLADFILFEEGGFNYDVYYDFDSEKVRDFLIMWLYMRFNKQTAL